MISPKIDTKEYVWESVADDLRQRIEAMHPRSRMPTVRSLMREFNASQRTVKKALDVIEKEGLITAPHVGRGIFVADSSCRQKTIMILRGDYPSQRGDDVTRALLSAIDGAAHRGLTITYHDMKHAMEVLTPLKPSDGYILQPLGAASIPVSLLNFLRSRSPAVVVSESDIGAIDVDCTFLDRMQQMSMCIRHLRSLGHRRISMVSGEAPMWEKEKFSLFRQISGWLEVEDKGDLIISCDTHPGEDARQKMQERMDSLIRENNAHLPFTAIVCAGYVSALGAIEAFQKHGIAVPGDVSVVVADNADVGDSNHLGLTLAGASSAQQAAELMGCLTRRWDEPEHPYGTVFMEPVLVKGTSSGPVSSQP